MTVINIDLDDGLPPVSFTLKHSDVSRFMEFMEDNNKASKEIESLRAYVERLENRDGKSSIYLCFGDEENPFRQEKLKVVDFGVSDNVYIVESEVVNSLRAKLAKAEKDAERLRGLRELCGYIQDGSDTSVHISQDDATRNWHLSLGPLKIGQKWRYAETFNGVIDAAIAKGEV